MYSQQIPWDILAYKYLSLRSSVYNLHSVSVLQICRCKFTSIISFRFTGRCTLKICTKPQPCLMRKIFLITGGIYLFIREVSYRHQRRQFLISSSLLRLESQGLAHDRVISAHKFQNILFLPHYQYSVFQYMFNNMLSLFINSLSKFSIFTLVLTCSFQLSELTVNTYH